MIKFFTYGTFRNGECRHYILTGFGAEFVGQVKTASKYRLTNLGSFPGMLENGTSSITGELYNLPEKALSTFDAIESHPSFFFRTNIELADGTIAVSYVFPHDVDITRDIETGDWKHRA